MSAVFVALQVLMAFANLLRVHENEQQKPQNCLVVMHIVKSTIRQKEY